jgi:predicted amidohydrolase YtcJ
VILVSVALPSFAAQTAADLILTNARVNTMNSQQPWVEAVAIRGEQIIAGGIEPTDIGKTEVLLTVVGSKVVYLAPIWNPKKDSPAAEAR